MAWRDDLRPGSFRGVPFFIESHDASGGRRLARHEYPLRDLPYAEDMGRKAREWTVEAYVLGPDYMSARDRLLEAFEAFGPGALVHPYLGTLSVAVDSYRLRESTREGGMATFSITFVESGEEVSPDERRDTAAIVGASADAAADVITGEFADGFDVSGPEFVREDAVGVIGAVADVLDSVTKGIPVVPAALYAYRASVTRLRSSVTSLIARPVSLAAEIRSMIESCANLTTSPLRLLEMLQSLFTFKSAPGARSTSSRARVASNRTALDGLVRGMALVEAVRASSVAEYASAGEASAVRDRLADALDVEAMTAPDTTYMTLSDLRTSMVRDLSARGMMLPRVTNWTPATTLPALVVAYRVHGDATRESDIVTRNNVRHPGAVPGGSTLEVLADV